jgi:hypothetical protein
MAPIASHQSWADFVDEATTDVDDQSKRALAVVNDIVLTKVPINDARKMNKDLAGVAALPDSEPSAGSSHHRTGRCKPCAFYHTKGCQNAKACEFCHLCPPGEKQRRKRLQERMCEKLGQFQRQTPFEQVDQRCFKSGHQRQASGASMGESSSQSTCSGWTKFSHSRGSSSSSVADSTAVVQSPMCGMPHMHQMMPVYHFAQGVMPTMADSAECRTAEPARANATNEISLAQVVPLPGNKGNNAPMPAAAPEQMAVQWQHNGVMPEQMATQWGHNGVVQYALVPVAVPMPQHQQHADPSMSYGCYAQQPQPQMEQAQWCAQFQMQAGANYAQPSF